MKLRGAHFSALLILILCGSSFSQIHFQSGGYGHNYLASVPHTQSGPTTIEPVNSGDIVFGSIPDGAEYPNCKLGATQYRIEFPGGPRKLVVESKANQSSHLYIRRNSPVEIKDGNIVADLSTIFFLPNQRLTVATRSPLSPGDPLLKPGTYFIAILNCAPGVMNYTLSVNIQDPPDVERINLTGREVEVGTVPALNSGFCQLGRTQYTVGTFFSPCGGASAWSVTINADQNVNVYIRTGKPVTVENGIVMYDFVTKSQAKVQQLTIGSSKPGTEVHFIAIENCNFDPANYVVLGGVVIGDPTLPFISDAFFVKKDLHIAVSGILNWQVFFDGQQQEKVEFRFDSDRRFVAIVKKAKKRIARHQTVIITIKDPGSFPSPCGPFPFAFTRP